MAGCVQCRQISTQTGANERDRRAFQVILEELKLFAYGEVVKVSRERSGVSRVSLRSEKPSLKY